MGLPLCDPGSYPQNPCTPDSDANSGAISDPNAAGAAFLELQLYPPGSPGPDAPGCTATQWCSAMTIDSLESTFNFADLNLACVEPVNYALLATDGVPAGPPSPQLANIRTFTPDAHTARVTDLTTHTTGFMVGSVTHPVDSVMHPVDKVGTRDPAHLPPALDESRAALMRSARLTAAVRPSA